MAPVVRSDPYLVFIAEDNVGIAIHLWALRTRGGSRFKSKLGSAAVIVGALVRVRSKWILPVITPLAVLLGFRIRHQYLADRTDSEFH